MAGRRTSQMEAHAELLQAGLDLAIERGPSLGLEHITFAAAIEHANVTRPTAYRSFPATETLEPQERFRNEVAVRIVNSCQFGDLSGAADAAAPLFSAAIEPGVTDDELSWLLRELIRLGGMAYAEQCATDELYPAYFSVLLAAKCGNPDLLAEVQREELDSSKGFIEFYRAVFDTFGIRLRAGWTWEMFAGVIAIASVGDYLQVDVSAMPASIDRPTGRDNETVEWTPFSLVVESIFMTAAEPDPKMVASANPLAWVS